MRLLLVGCVLLCLRTPAFADSPPAKHVVVTVCEDEYRAAETLPPFMRHLARRHGLQLTVLLGNREKTNLDGLEALQQADLLVMFLRRTTLPDDQLERFRAYFDRGGNVLALRTSSHGFQNWLAFDRLVLGGNYQGHYGRSLLPTVVTPTAAGKRHPITSSFPDRYLSRGTLYRTSPVAADAQVLLVGKAGDRPPEPVAWIRSHRGGTVFYTSLGHPDDFRQPAFQTMLERAVLKLLGNALPADSEQGARSSTNPGG